MSSPYTGDIFDIFLWYIAIFKVLFGEMCVNMLLSLVICTAQ